MDQMNETRQETPPAYRMEGARSSRSRCKACRKKIAKDSLRIGFFIQGPFGDGYLWHHLKCAARRFPDKVEEAYAQSAWETAKDPVKVPALKTLLEEAQAALARRPERKTLPFAEVDPSGRARCKHCGEAMQKGDLRIALGRRVEFGSQVRIAPIKVHPGCVKKELDEESCDTESSGFATAVRSNSTALSAEQVEAALAGVGALEANPTD